MKEIIMQLLAAFVQKAIHGSGKGLVLIGVFLDELQISTAWGILDADLHGFAVLGQFHGNRIADKAISVRSRCFLQRILTEGHPGKGDLALRAGDSFGNELAGGIRQLEVDACKRLVCLRVGFENGDITDCAGVGDRLAHSLPGVRDFNGDRDGVQNITSRGRCFGQLVGAEDKAGEDELAVRCGVALLRCRPP